MKERMSNIEQRIKTKMKKNINATFFFWKMNKKWKKEKRCRENVRKGQTPVSFGICFLLRKMDLGQKQKEGEANREWGMWRKMKTSKNHETNEKKKTMNAKATRNENTKKKRNVQKSEMKNNGQTKWYEWKLSKKCNDMSFSSMRWTKNGKQEWKNEHFVQKHNMKPMRNETKTKMKRKTQEVERTSWGSQKSHSS